jgi:hypothetical protein
VVPNRRGLWCLSETTPFGHGQPFSVSQLKDALRSMLFSPGRSATALYVPPSRSPLLLRTAVAWERVGLRWAQPFAGVLAMTAAKQIYALPSEPAKRRRHQPAYAPAPQTAAAAERVTPTSGLDQTDAMSDRRDHWNQGIGGSRDTKRRNPPFGSNH